jgi:SAM-dependent methyltransferase
MIEKILNYIYDKSPTQRKKLPKVLSENPEISKELDLFLSNYSIFMDKSNISYKDICDAYELLNIQMTYSRLHFLETGDYPAHEYRDEIFSNIYNNENTMSNYMLGVALSQFLWKHHFMIYQFYKKTVNKLRDKKNFLEIGPGHGLFLLELIKSIKHKEATFDCIDLSKISLNISKELIGAIKPEILPQIRFIQGDINLFNENITYDFITMG